MSIHPAKPQPTPRVPSCSVGGLPAFPQRLPIRAAARLIAGLALSWSMAATAADLAPGRNPGQPVENQNHGWTFDVYLPKAYFADDAPALPVLYISAPKANPGTYRLDGWAERRGVILAAINASANGQSAETRTLIQERTLASVEKHVRVHPQLRFAIGHSGGAWASRILVANHAQQFAGLMMQIHIGGGEPLPKWMPVGFYLGEQDANIPIAAARAEVESLRSAGNPVKLEVHPGGHAGAGPEHLAVFLDWMLDYALLTNPNLPRPEVAKNLIKADERIAGLSSVADPEARRDQALAMLEVPPLATGKRGESLRTAWAEAGVALAAAASDPWRKHDALLALSEHAQFAGVPAAVRSTVGKQLTELRATAPVKDEWAALQALRATRVARSKAGAVRARLTEVAQQLRQIGERWPATEAGKAALADAADLSAPAK